MHVASVRLCNFLSHVDSTVQLANRGLLLIDGENRDSGGSNGAGKSAIFEGIRWATYGTTSRGIKQNEVCRRGFGDTLCEVTYLDDTNIITISRYRNHTKFGNQLKLSINGKDATKSSEKETQAAIFGLLQLDDATFANTVLYAQNMQGFASMTDSDQKAIFERLLGFERFTKAQERAKAFESKLTQRLLLLKTEEATWTREIVEHEERLKQLRLQAQAFAEAKKLRLTDLTAQVIDLTQKIAQHPAQASEARIAELQAQLTASDSAALLDLARQCDQRINTLQSELATHVGTQSFSGKMLQAIPTLDVEAEVAKQVTCLACGQSLPPTAVENIRQFLLKKQADQEAQKATHTEALNTALGLAEELRSKIQRLHNTKNGVQEQLHAIEDLKKQLYAIQEEARASRATLSHLEAQRLTLEARIGEVTAQTFDNSGLVNQEEHAVAAKRVQRQSAIEAIQSCSSTAAYFAFWTTGFGNKGVKSLLLDAVTTILNDRGNAYLRYLTGGTAELNFTTQVRIGSGELRDKFSVEVIYHTGGNAYKSISGGESRRIDVAVALALGDLAASRARAPIKLRLLDEPFESIDSIGRERVVQLLRDQIVPNAGTVAVMTQQDELKQLFEHRITVVKEGGISRVIDHR